MPTPLDPLQARREAVRRELRARGIDAALIGPGANLHYLTDNWGHLGRRFTVLLLGAHGQEQELFVCPAFEESMHRQAVRGVTEFRSWQRRDFAQQTALQALGDWGLRAGRIALDQAIPWLHVEPLVKAAPRFEYVSAADSLAAVRMIKSPDELAQMRAATQAANRAIAQTCAQLQLGAGEADLERQFVAAAEDPAGGAESWILMLFGPSSAEPHGSPDRRQLAAGDVALMDFGTSRGMYRSDTTRTVLFGNVPDEARRVWDIVERAYRAARAAARPGITYTELDAVARKVIADAGYADYFTHGLGHGIGLEVHERPYPEPVGDAPLAAGMTITIEPGIYLPGRFGVRLEDVVVITPEGCEPIDPGPPMRPEP